MKKFLFILICAIIGIGFANAKDITANYGKVAGGYNFWLYTPDGADKDEVKKPVVIFLHGRSLCGTDLNKVRRYGTISAIERGRDIDAYVIAPQNPGESWKPEKIMKVLEYVSSKHNVDSDRVYVLGMSLGGYGTIDFAAAYPDKVAAAVALCGGGTAKNLADLNKLPLWIIHGTADAAVPVSASDRVAAAMRKAEDGGSRLIYDRLPGVNHGQLARMFYLADTYDWLFSHSLTDEGRTLNKGFDSLAAMKTAYRNLNWSKRSYASAKTGGSSSKKMARKATTKKSKRVAQTATSAKRKNG